MPSEAMFKRPTIDNVSKMLRFKTLLHRLLHARDDAGGGKGAGSEVRAGDGAAHGHVQERAPHPVDRRLRRRRGKVLELKLIDSKHNLSVRPSKCLSISTYVAQAQSMIRPLFGAAGHNGLP